MRRPGDAREGKLQQNWEARRRFSEWLTGTLTPLSLLSSSSYPIICPFLSIPPIAIAI